MVKRPIALADASRVLEDLFPGLSAYAKNRSDLRREKLRQVWARNHPDKPTPTSDEVDALPPEVNNDYVADFAVERGLELSRRAISPSLRQPSELFASLFPHMPSGDILVVLGARYGHLVSSSELRAFLVNEEGARLMDLDAVVVEMSTGSVHVLTEDGWFFTIRTGNSPKFAPA